MHKHKFSLLQPNKCQGHLLRPLYGLVFSICDCVEWLRYPCSTGKESIVCRSLSYPKIPWLIELLNDLGPAGQVCYPMLCDAVSQKVNFNAAELVLGYICFLEMLE